MQKVNKGARKGMRAAAKGRGRKRRGAAVRERGAAAEWLFGGKMAQKGRAPRIVRARVFCSAPLYFAAASALFAKGVPVWLSQKAETPFLRRPCTAKYRGMPSAYTQMPCVSSSDANMNQ